MRVRGGVLLLIVQALLLAPESARAQTSTAGITGSYDGRYQCGEWSQLNLQLRDLGGGRLSAVFTFVVLPRLGSGQGSFAMTGQYDERTGRVQLAPEKWLHRPRGYDMVGLDAVFDRGSRTLRGKVIDFNCQGFEVVPHGTPLAALPQPQRPVPAERGRAVFNLTNYLTGPLEYWDAAIDS